MSSLVSHPRWRFKIDPRVRKALHQLQNDNAATSFATPVDFGMPMKRPENPMILNSYVNTAPSAPKLPSAPGKPLFSGQFSAWQTSEASPRQSASTSPPPLFSLPEKDVDWPRVLTATLVGGSAAYWTWQLWALKRRPSSQTQEIANRKFQEAESQRRSVEGESVYVASFSSK